MAKRIQIPAAQRCYDVAILHDVELPLEATGEGCQFRRISHCRWRPRFRFFEPAFRPVFLGLVLDGEGVQYDAQGRTTPLRPGCVLACGGGYRGHAVTASEGIELLFLVTHSHAAAQLANDRLGPLPVAFPTPRAGELEQLFRILLREGERMGRDAVRACNRLGEALILQAGEALTEGPRRLSRREAAFLRARRHILEHAAAPLTAAGVAAAAGISRAYLARVFAEFAGEPPLAYIQRQRMAVATERLQTGAQTVQQVAYSLGFSDPLSFSRTFKRVTGRPPSTLLPKSEMAR
jgi:AraC-like DNA-binding protein